MRLPSALTVTLRNLCGRPSLPLLATTALALGIGVTTAMFSILDTLLIRPLPFPGAERLVQVQGMRADGTGSPFLAARAASRQRASAAAAVI